MVQPNPANALTRRARETPQLVYDALEFALLRHDGQLRRHRPVPYVVHPLRIFATLTLKLGVTDPETLAAALLHDTIEDTRTDYDDLRSRFGTRVADLVAAMTKDMRLPEKEREEAFMRQVDAAPLEARIVKLCDNYDNLLDSLPLDPAKRRESATRKRPHVESLCAGMPEELRWFRLEVLDLLRRCLA